MGLDFSQLYSLLGLEPGCSLDELKHAYRKRVAELHPDRRSAAGIGQDTGSRQLAALTPLYRSALRFHEEHGRLPGSDVGDAAPTAVRMPGRRPEPGAERGTDASPPPRTPASHWWLLVALAALVGYLVLGASGPRA